MPKKESNGKTLKIATGVITFLGLVILAGMGFMADANTDIHATMRGDIDTVQAAQKEKGVKDAQQDSSLIDMKYELKELREDVNDFRAVQTSYSREILRMLNAPPERIMQLEVEAMDSTADTVRDTT